MALPLPLILVFGVVKGHRQPFDLLEFLLQGKKIFLCSTVLAFYLQLKPGVRFVQRFQPLVEAGQLFLKAASQLQLLKVVDQSKPKLSHGVPNDLL